MIDASPDPAFRVAMPEGTGLPPQRAQQFGRRLEVLLQNGNIESAHLLVDEAERIIDDRRRLRSRDEILSVHLVNVVPLDLANLLEQLRINTVGDLHAARFRLADLPLGPGQRTTLQRILQRIDALKPGGRVSVTA